MTTLPAVKDFLRIPVVDELNYDSQLERMINAVSEQVEAYCGRHFEKADYIELYQGDGTDLLYLKQYPLIAVDAVVVDGETLDVAEYTAQDSTLYCSDRWTDTGKKDIQVSYSAGYVLPKDEDPGPPAVERTLPYDLEDAVIELVATKFYLRQEDAAGKASRIQEDFNVRFEKGIPDHIRRVLDNYRKVRV